MDLLADYVDGALPREQAELLEWHIESCAPCVHSSTPTVEPWMPRSALRQATLPPELRDKLIAFLQRSNVR